MPKRIRGPPKQFPLVGGGGPGHKMHAEVCKSTRMKKLRAKIHKDRLVILIHTLRRHYISKIRI